MKLNKDTFKLFAARHYENPSCISEKEFEEDLFRFVYLNKLFRRYELNGVLCERLILNHIIVIYNVFQPTEAATQMLFFKTAKEHWPVLKTFLLYLNYLPSIAEPNKSITVDLHAAEKLRKV
jgi:hypothetical protein